MIGLRLRFLCQNVALRRSFQTSSFVRPKSPILLQLSNWNRTVNQLSLRCINTTKKNKDHHIDIYDPEYVNVKKPKGPETAKDFADVNTQKNWISYGFDYVDPKNDAHLLHGFMFSLVTLSMITFCFLLYYFPDYLLHDWSLREGYMELDRREKLGLPLIDRNLVDPAKLVLPSDEELGDYEVYL